MRHLAVIAAFISGCIFPTSSNAQQFDDFFVDKTLRIDYSFAGDAKKQDIYLEELCEEPHWYGRRSRLSELPLEGNGQITVRSKKGEVIYRHSFSTLFQEWLTYPEAETTKKAFENVFLVPFPKDTVDITVSLMNNRREVMASLTHQVVPSDILIHKKGFRGQSEYTVINSPADPDHCIHLAYIAEGYKEDQMDLFEQEARMSMELLFTYEPFKSMRDRFEVVAVKAASHDEGMSEPGKGIWKNTVLGSHFDTFYSERYLTTLSMKKLNDMLAGVPYEHIIILVNSERYGGGGIYNSYMITTTRNERSKPVIVHEFGHSFAGLGDEYAYESDEIPMYPHDIEPWEKNLTTLVDFKGKWEDMIKKGTPIPTPLSDDEKTQFSRIGVFEGAGYSVKGVYRPCQRCRMLDNTTPDFCAVCQRAIKDIIDFYTLP